MPRFRRATADELRARRRALHLDVEAGGFTYAECIKRMRASMGMSQARFGAVFQMTPRQVMELESGKSNPTVETLRRLGRIFGFDVGFVRRKSPMMDDNTSRL